jgi:hypothetical protein
LAVDAAAEGVVGEGEADALGLGVAGHFEDPVGGEGGGGAASDLGLRESGLTCASQQTHETYEAYHRSVRQEMFR